MTEVELQQIEQWGAWMESKGYSRTQFGDYMSYDTDVVLKLDPSTPSWEAYLFITDNDRVTAKASTPKEAMRLCLVEAERELLNLEKDSSDRRAKYLQEISNL